MHSSTGLPHALPRPDQECHLPADTTTPKVLESASGGGKTEDGGNKRLGSLLHDCEGSAVVRVDVTFPARLHKGAGGTQQATPSSGSAEGSGGDSEVGEDAGMAALSDWRDEVAAMLGDASCFKMERLGPFSVRVTAPVANFQVGITALAVDS